MATKHFDLISSNRSHHLEGRGKGDPMKPGFWRSTWNPYAQPRTSQERLLLEEYRRFVEMIDRMATSSKPADIVSDIALRCVARTFITFHDDDSIVSDVSTTIGILSRNDNNGLRLGQYGICEELVYVLRREASQCSICECSCGAMINLCYVVSENRTLFGELGACEALLDILCNNFEDGPICEWLISSMTILATDHAKNRSRMLCMCVPSVLRFLLLKYSGQVQNSPIPEFPVVPGGSTLESIRAQIRKCLDTLESVV